MFAILALLACGGEPMADAEPVPDVPTYRFEDVTPEQWAALARRKLFFGHQSVGGNIMAGIAAVLQAHPEILLRIVEASPDSLSAPGLYHARIGQNGDPASKANAFTAIAESAHPDVALLKYCYVDVVSDTDPDALFADYQRRMEDLRARQPGLVIVHMTMPLTTHENWKGILMSKLQRTTSQRELGVIRNRYNRLLVRAYARNEPVFDLARLESTRPDGTRVFFERNGQQVYALEPSYSDDGAHLVGPGQRYVAEAFLAFLANLPGEQN
jgi:hypothetical protein